MKAWLRWILVIIQILGGIIGIVSTLMYMFGSDDVSPITLVILMAFVALYAIVTIAGVRLALNERHITLMRLAIWLQIPIISSPIFAWIFSAGFSLNLTWIGAELGINFWLGSRWQFYLLKELPWGIGINLFTLSMLILLRYLKSPQENKFPGIASQVDTILQYRLLNTPLANRGIHLQSLPNGSICVIVGSDRYPAIDDVPDEEVKLQIRSAIEEWEKKSRPNESSSTGLPTER